MTRIIRTSTAHSGSTFRCPGQNMKTFSDSCESWRTQEHVRTHFKGAEPSSHTYSCLAHEIIQAISASNPRS
ncbi:hypothetical protein KM043_011236 [Ampulex compressa]|nr:hypothetical protein KM043_011236 [Ampulex compressa]